MEKKITIPEVIERFKQYHKKNSEWGSLHIVLADDNFQDYFVKSCIEDAHATGDSEGEELAKILLQMSYTQRRKLSRLPVEISVIPLDIITPDNAETLKMMEKYPNANWGKR